MFFKYNKITQSLASATQDVAIGRPVTPEAFKVHVRESPEINYDYKPLKAAEVAQVSHEESGKYLVPNTKRFKRLMSLQAQFLANDGRLVWQKFATDRTLYYVAAGMTAVAVLFTLDGLRRLASPPKN